MTVSCWFAAKMPGGSSVSRFVARSLRCQQPIHHHITHSSVSGAP